MMAFTVYDGGGGRRRPPTDDDGPDLSREEIDALILAIRPALAPHLRRYDTRAVEFLITALRGPADRRVWHFKELLQTVLRRLTADDRASVTADLLRTIATWNQRADRDTTPEASTRLAQLAAYAAEMPTEMQIDFVVLAAALVTRSHADAQDATRRRRGFMRLLRRTFTAPDWAYLGKAAIDRLHRWHHTDADTPAGTDASDKE